MKIRIYKTTFFATLFAIFFGAIIGYQIHYATANADAPIPVNIDEIPTVTPTPTPGMSTMYLLINRVRQQNKLTALGVDPRLEVSAKKKACDMRDKNYFSHADPKGVWSWHLIKESGYPYVWAGENLIQGYSNGEDAMVSLLASSTHREQILKPVYTDMGIASCGEYTVQHFAAK